MLARISSSQHFRWIIVGMLFGLSFASYVERVNISVAAELMMPSLALSKSDMSLIFNGFLIGYALFQVPLGWLGDRFGARLVLGSSAIAWGVLTLATGFLPGVLFKTAAGMLVMLMTLRFLLGLAEASTYPVAARAVHQWMLPSQRGTGSSMMLMGSSVASALTAPFVAFCMWRFGWRASFYITALVAFAMGSIWFCFARTAPVATAPVMEHSKSPTSQLDSASPRGRWLSVDALLLSLSYASEGYLLFTFISWLYIYLVEVRGFSLVNGGLMSSLPWIAAIAATPLGGLLSDRLTKRFGRFRSAQAIIMSGYSLSGILLLVAAAVHGRMLAVLALSISLGAMYLAESSFWTTATAIAGPHAAVVAGFMNTIGIVGGIASTSLVPLLVKHYGHTGWIIAFGSATAMGMMTALVWWVLGRRLEKSGLYELSQER
jgi:ACS family glucarate transporter-like MFS transporter